MENQLFGKVLTSLRTKKVKSWTCEKCGKVLVFHSFTSLLFSDIYVCVLENPSPARMKASKVQTAACIFDLDGKTMS